MASKPKIKIKIAEQLNHKKPPFITVKTSLKKILNQYDLNFPIINQLVIDCHQIVTKTYQFIRLYMLDQYLKDQVLPPINKDFILSCIRIGGQVSAQGRRPSKTDLEQKLMEFYDLEFQPCINQPKYDLKYKSFIVPYLAVQIQTSFENNIKEHFLKRIRKLMNILKPVTITNEKMFKKIKNIILLDKHDLIPMEYQVWSHQIKTQFLPSSYQKCYGYDVKVDPYKYLPYLIKMNQEIERRNTMIQQSQLTEVEKNKQIQRLFQPIPLRTSKIPCYITLDANSIVSIFYQHDKGRIGHHIADHRDQVWSSLFHTEHKIMRKKGYHFCSIQTDGIGVSICFQRDDLTYREKQNQDKETPPKSLEELSDSELSGYQRIKLVGGDPGKQSSIYLMDQEKHRLRYTPRQRRSESQVLICQRIMESEKENYNVNKAEAILSSYNSKTVNYQRFKDYIIQEQIFHQRTDHFYQQEIWRKMKWRIWINRRRSEDQFLNRIETVYGHPEDIVICYGNWSENQQMKYLMPSQGIGLRRIISKRFKIIMVDEYRTSKLCNQCHHQLESFQGLYRVRFCPCCQSNRSESKCCFFNRDANACMNILFLSREWLHHRIRPVEYNRTMLLTAQVENLEAR